MSINISKALAAVSDVSVTIHMDRLTKGQHASVARQVERGVILGSAVTSKIAKHLLDTHNLPYIQMRHFGYVCLTRIPIDPTHPLREALATADAASAMINPERHADWNRDFDFAVRKNGWAHVDKHARDSSFKNVSCKNEIEIPAVFVLPMV